MDDEITVLIADDHALVRHGVRNLLTMQPDMRVIGDVATGQDVLRPNARGHSNAGIATTLVLSEHTGKGYVSTVLGKLQVADRTQATVIAWREGLLGLNTDK